MLTIQYKKIKDLIPYVNNSRTHSEAQVAQIASSIKEFGWTNPILLDGENGIIAGHGRLMAGQLLGHEEAPTIELSHLTEHQKKAYVIADNKLALNAGWDFNILKMEFEDLNINEFDITKLGFDVKEINQILGIENVINIENEPTNETRNLLMIECEGERELEKLYEEMQERGFQCKILS
jgi:ParB-like chromosome segregation protein Spo0J